MGRLLLLISLLGISAAAGLTWPQTQQLRVYKDARIALGDANPGMAVSKLRPVLESKDLDTTAELNIRAVLGEALVRANQPEEALKILTGSGPKSLTWRAHALSQLGNLEEAAALLENLKTKEANYQRALIFLGLGEREAALSLLTPLEEACNSERTLAIAIQLDLGQLEEAESLLKVSIKNPSTEDTTLRYLNARLQLLKKNRALAVGSFQALVSANNEELQLPSAYIHAAHLGLADSLALDGNEKEASASLMETLEKFPDFPLLSEVFDRLETWRAEIDLQKLKDLAPTHVPLLKGGLLFPKPIIGSLDHGTLSPKAAHALYLLALLDLDAEKPRIARVHLSRLRMGASELSGELVDRSLIETGLTLLADQRYQDALSTFSLLDNQTSTSNVRATAKALQGTAAFALQDPKQALKAFAEARSLADQFNQKNLAEAASFNAGITALQAGRAPSLKELPSLSVERLKLERGLILANRRDPESRSLLESFLKEDPESPRRNEAALALAENYDPTSKDQSQLALDLLNELEFDDPTESDLSARRVLALLSLGEGSDDAKLFLVKNPAHPRAAELLFKQGQVLMKQASGDAIVSFERLIDRFPKHPLAETARFLSARASASVGGEPNIARALERYEQIIKKGGPLATAAAIDLTRLQIDRSEQDAALARIEALLKDEKLSPQERRSLLVLGAEAASQNAHYDEALSFYDQLLSLKDLPVAWFNRASFLRGRVLEDLGRQNDALKTYYQVVLNNLDPANMTEVEWTWHDKCARLGALPLLERNNEWKAALSLALRVAQSGGPSAKEFAERARKIKFEQMIFDEKE
ncbi:tetratricopeptide repeat protein [bacterium]|nr:tetratricopeptide repeat protein [Akkermansiaceae bacterium]MDB4406975.1 tetratricopeptide repeat protein [bacterium]MDB4498831.1 tetratricopeptide repeat protein [Akkermansiaceae bacterium]